MMSAIDGPALVRCLRGRAHLLTECGVRRSVEKSELTSESIHEALRNVRCPDVRRRTHSAQNTPCRCSSSCPRTRFSTPRALFGPKPGQSSTSATAPFSRPSGEHPRTVAGAHADLAQVLSEPSQGIRAVRLLPCPQFRRGQRVILERVFCDESF